MTTPKPGRKDAYMLRARARYLRAAEEVIATTGPDATIEQFALHADVAIATLYKHFGSKEGLIKAAMLDAAQKWEAWQFEVLSHVTDPLEQLALGLRLALRIRTTHPTLAVVLLRGRAAGYFDPREMGLTFTTAARALAEWQRLGAMSARDEFASLMCDAYGVPVGAAREQLLEWWRAAVSDARAGDVAASVRARG